MPSRITSEHIQNIYKRNKFNLEYFTTTIKPNLATEALRPDHRISCKDYRTVWVTSDIHEDFRKFIQMLTQYGLIETDIDPYNGDDIYKPELIGNATWKGGKKALLVIIGDLVDGRRQYGISENHSDDPRGSFEFLLHAFLYNLRLSALENQSDVLFTIGNHDLHTVIAEKLFGMNDVLYDTYVSKNAKQFFISHKNRREALLPFYNISPYYILSMMNDGKKEVAFVHGGLHGQYDGSVFANQLEAFQEKISKGSAKLPDFLTDSDLPNSNNQEGPMWSRYYSQKETGVCDTIQNTAFNFIIVGHCPTIIQTNGHRFKKLQTSNPKKYSKCDDGVGNDSLDKIGCVMMDCEHHPTKLAFVDVGLSKGQRLPLKEIDNSKRIVQILKLTHTRDDSSMYYDVVEGVNSDGTVVTLYDGVPELLPLPPSPSPSPPPVENNYDLYSGGARTRTYKKTYKKRRSRRHKSFRKN